MNIAKKKRPCKFSDEKKRHGDYYHHREKRYVNKKRIRGSLDFTISPLTNDDSVRFHGRTDHWEISFPDFTLIKQTGTILCKNYLRKEIF